jgi:hypothetical protein
LYFLTGQAFLLQKKGRYSGYLLVELLTELRDNTKELHLVEN